MPEWTIISAGSDYTPGSTVNEAEYRGLQLGLDLFQEKKRGSVIICGDSNLVIRQITGEIDCKAPRLKLLNDNVMETLRGWPNHDLLHVKRDWNRSADHLATMVLRDQTGSMITDNAVLEELVEINRLPELIHSEDEGETAQVQS